MIVTIEELKKLEPDWIALQEDFGISINQIAINLGYILK